MRLQSLASTVAFFFAFTSHAIEVSDRAEREALFRNAIVWSQPSWISDSFQFSDTFDIEMGPQQKGNLTLLLQKLAVCTTNQDDQIFGKTGFTRKFYCQLMSHDASTNEYIPLFKENGKRERIKVKYHAPGRENGEVYAEVLGTRLLWALGFAADQMFPMENVYCFGCTTDPFVNRQVDPTSLKTPRIFKRTAIEVQYPGKEIKFINPPPASTLDKNTEGWRFDDLMRFLPYGNAEREEAIMHRDALRLLSVMIHHVDNKSDNHRVVCPPGGVVNNQCVTRPVFLIHDIGSTFGTTNDWVRKVDYNTWIRDPIWKDPRNCRAQIIHPDLPDKSVRDAAISEAGRRLLSELLAGFSDGEIGRRRVESLFLAAHLDRRNSAQTIAMWTNAFLRKAEEIRFPLGRSNPDFTCPQ